MMLLFKYPAFLLAWLCWALGETAYFILSFKEHDEKWVGKWYQRYNRAMNWSHSLQNWAGGQDKPWPWGESWGLPENGDK